MITVYVECPFVLQLALKQEHAERCERIASAAAGGAFEIALPIVALVEPLYVQRGDVNERRMCGEPASLEAWLKARGLTL